MTLYDASYRFPFTRAGKWSGNFRVTKRHVSRVICSEPRAGASKVWRRSPPRTAAPLIQRFYSGQGSVFRAAMLSAGRWAQAAWLGSRELPSSIQRAVCCAGWPKEKITRVGEVKLIHA